MTIANISVSHGFIVDESISCADFMIVHGINLNKGKQIIRRLAAVEQQKLPPQCESFIWVRVEGDCEESRL